MKAPVRQNPRPPMMVDLLLIRSILDKGFKTRNVAWHVNEAGDGQRAVVTAYLRTSINQANVLKQWDLVLAGRDERSIIEFLSKELLDLPELA